MEAKDIIKNIKAYKLDNDTGKIQLNINEYNYYHNEILLHKLKEYITYNTIMQYSSLNSNYQEELLYKLSKYINVLENQILLVNGGDVSINIILKTYCSNKSNIIIYNPTYSQYERIAMTITTNIHNINVDLDNKQKLNEYLLSIDSNILSNNNNNQRTICFICNPNNPTGKEWSKSELHQLFETYPNILFIIDETYIDFSYLSDYNNIYSCTDCINKYNNIIIMKSFSKAFGLAGLRIGYLISNKENIKSIFSITSHKDITELAKLAAITVLDNISYYKNQINLLLRDKNTIIQYCNLNNIKYKDTKCNFILINADGHADELTNLFLQNNILVKNLNNIYNNELNDYVRISLHSEYIYKIISILQQFKYRYNPILE